MNTPSDYPLDQQRKVVADLRAHIAREELILEGMERMAAFIPVKAPVSRAKSAPRDGATSRGRQPGAISKRWRAVFNALVCEGNRFNDDAVVETVQYLEKRVMRRSEVRRLFEVHRVNDLVAFNDDGTYSVTDHAIAKFDLGRNADDILGDTAPNENEAPSGNPPEPQKPAGWGVAAPSPAPSNPNPWPNA